MSIVKEVILHMIFLMIFHLIFHMIFHMIFYMIFHMIFHIIFQMYFHCGRGYISDVFPLWKRWYFRCISFVEEVIFQGKFLVYSFIFFRCLLLTMNLRVNHYITILQHVLWTNKGLQTTTQHFLRFSVNADALIENEINHS